MKKTCILIPLVILLMLQGCMKRECGKSVTLGENLVMEESKENFFPYFSIDEMTFVSTSGIVLTMKVESRFSVFRSDLIRYICYNNRIDFAAEYYRNERLSVRYEGSYYLNNYELRIDLSVKRSLKGKYYDELFCKYYGKGSAGKEKSAYFWMMAHNRGNSFTISEIEDVSYGRLEFEKEVEINGVVYYDVWHNRNKVFYQKGRGVFAFKGLDEEFYVLQE